MTPHGTGGNGEDLEYTSDLNGGSHPPSGWRLFVSIRERLAKVEGTLSVLKAGITWMLVLISLAVGFGYFQFDDLRSQVAQTRSELRNDIRNLDRKIDAIPEKLTNLANTIANSRSEAPIFIQVPQSSPGAQANPTPDR